MMTDEKIKISWDDLQSRRVENRLREQQAMARTRAYAQMRDDALPEATAPAPPSIWNKPVFYMAFFGLLGGLLAWGAGIALQFKPTAQEEAAALLTSLQHVDIAREIQHYDANLAHTADEQIRAEGRNNPYFVVATDPTLSDSQRKARTQELIEKDRYNVFLVHTLAYGVCGALIAMCLAMAEPLTQHKFKAAFGNGVAGAVLGMIGGVAAALLMDQITKLTGAFLEEESDMVRQIASQSAVWGALGLFLGLASGLLLRNVKKLGIGLAGGLLGGLIGGALFLPVQGWTHHDQIAKLVALVAIGVIAGAGTGFIEDAAKAGWLKVQTGIIAGKQFILYRNPTYIGSAPDCQIYLFKDPQVGKRHAALHLLPTGIEIENLPLGGDTFVNDKPVQRARIRNGDRIQIGKTLFNFQEKKPR